jgi:hypothetical protein
MGITEYKADGMEGLREARMRKTGNREQGTGSKRLRDCEQEIGVH